MKKIEWAVALGLIVVFVIALFQIPFSSACEVIRAETLRVHIVANSNSGDDQEIKLVVRDAVLQSMDAALENCADRDAALLAVSNNLGAVEKAANAALSAGGFRYTAKAYICDMYFETRQYGDVTLPAGNYTAVRVELGAAAGDNWWCVMYPALCLPSAESDKEILEESFTDQEVSVLLGGERYAVRFKLEEWWSRLLSGDPAQRV